MSLSALYTAGKACETLYLFTKKRLIKQTCIDIYTDVKVIPIKGLDTYDSGNRSIGIICVVRGNIYMYKTDGRLGACIFHVYRYFE